MTIVSSLAVSENALVADFAGGASGDVDMMIGISLVKDSEAVYFEYLGDDQQPAALMLPSGRPLKKLGNVKLVGLSIAENIGEFNTTKLNVLLESNTGRRVLVTSGLTTYWSQALMPGLMGLFNDDALSTPFNLETWKGKSAMRPSFCAVKIGQDAVTDNDMYQQLCDARSDRDKTKIETLMRDAVEILSHALTGEPIETVEVRTVEAPAEF